MNTREGEFCCLCCLLSVHKRDHIHNLVTQEEEPERRDFILCVSLLMTLLLKQAAFQSGQSYSRQNTKSCPDHVRLVQTVRLYQLADTPGSIKIIYSSVSYTQRCPCRKAVCTQLHIWLHTHSNYLKDRNEDSLETHVSPQAGAQSTTPLRPRRSSSPPQNCSQSDGF